MDDPSLGFGSQISAEVNFTQTLQEINSELNKFDEMEGVDENSEFLLNKESSCPAKPVTEATYVRRTFLPLVTSVSPSHVDRSERSPLVDLSNSLNSPTCTPLPPKPSWTRVNRIPYVSEEKLEVSLGEKRATPSKKNQQGGENKNKTGFSG